MVNNRPLTVENKPPLSQSTLLTGKTRLVLSPLGELKREDMCIAKKMKNATLGARVLRRWSKKYLQTLQIRTKWAQSR